MAKVYIANEVADILALHPALGTASFRAMPIQQQLEQQADTILLAHAAKDMRVLMHIMCWWPQARGQSRQAVLAGAFDQTDARETIAREYGFVDWAEVQALGDGRLDLSFEAALDALGTGDIGALQQMLDDKPDLAVARSPFGHRATLLHYLGANGVESHRQQMPLNAPDLARVLLDAGADASAHANIYGGRQSAYALAETSAHPHNAGIIAPLLEALTA